MNRTEIDRTRWENSLPPRVRQVWRAAAPIVRRSPDRWLGLALAVSSFLLYLRTLAPGILDGDSGEWQYMANILGVAHSTGYPLYLLLAKLVTLLPVGTPAWRVNLFSAICASLAVPLVYWLARRVSRSRPGALIAAAIFALAPTLWASAVEAEVYALNTLLVALTLYFGVRWYDSRQPRDLYLMALSFGLALDNHRVALFVAPGLLLLVWFQRRWLDRRRVALAAVLALLPLLLYAYIPLRATSLLQEQSAANWELYPRPEAILKGSVTAFYNPGLSGFLNLVTAFDNRNKLGFQNTVVDSMASRLSNSAGLLLQQFNPLALVLALVGVALLLKRERPLTLVLLASAAGIAAIGVLLHAESTRFYFSGAYLVLALLIAAGIGAVLAYLDGRPLWRAPALLLFVLMPLAALWVNFPQMDESRYDQYDVWARSVLSDNLAPNAVVIAPWEIVTGLRYLQFVEGQRPDLLLIHESPVRPQYQKILAAAHTLKRQFYYVLFTPEDKSAPGPRTVQAVGMPLLTAPAPRYPVNAELAGSVRVLGYDLSPDPAQPGRFLRVAIYYQVLAPVKGEYNAELDLYDIRGEPHGYWQRTPVSMYYPPNVWKAGEYYRDVWDIPFPADGPAGLYTLRLNWYPFDSGTNFTDRDHGSFVNLGPIRVGDFDAGEIPQTLHGEFANGMNLVGYRLNGGPGAGQKLDLSLYWKALHPVDTAYTVFVHLQDAGGVMRAQSDRPPWNGMFPTDRWPVGEIVRDDYLIPLPADLPHGAYQLRIGLYVTADRRVPLVSGGDPSAREAVINLDQ